MSQLRLANFFKDSTGLESMTALMLFLSFWPSTYVMVTQHNENIFYAYMASFAGLAANKQWATRGNNSNLDSGELANDAMGAGSVVTRSSTVVSQPLAQSVKPIRGGKARSRQLS